MKTLVSLLCCTALTVGSASAQSYRVARAGAFEENGRVEVGIPTSPLAVDLTVEKEVVTVGPYARYAQKFLGVRGALSDKTLYSVKAARVALLDRDATTASEVPAGEVRATSYLGDAETFSRVPFDKRSLVDESLETAARNAANTLFAIRRHRMELITSEAGEHVFGAGLQAALAELDRQEQAYTELFLGKRVTTTSVERITVVPDAGKQKYILCRFSPDRGLLPGNDLTGDVVLLQLDKESDGSFTLTPASPKAARTATYRVAADVVCTVYCGGADARYAAALRIRPRRRTGASVQEMTNHTARMAALLGELRREMNGAVAESMQRGEGGYGLNYGVSIPTIRAIAGRVGTDHAFARFLYRQDVRELRMAALTIADPVSVTPDNVDEWFVGRMPEELIEELALRLLSRCGRPVLDTLCGRWLRAGSGAERYAALMALARARVQEFDAAAVVEAVPDAVAACPDDLRLARGAAAFVQSASVRIAPERLARMIERLPDSCGGAYLRDELAWMIL